MQIGYPNTFDLSNGGLPSVIECDVVIVGSGAGGGVSAEILSLAGLKVVIVEEGPLKTAADFEMKEKAAYAELYQEVAGRQTLDQSIQILQGKCVGGSTTVNWTSSFRTPKQTLDFWRENFGLNHLDSEDLAPWFRWVENRLSVNSWALPPNQNNQKLADGAKKLGWSYEVIPRNVSGCANLGYCGTGCPINAKQSMLVACIATALENGAKLIYNARAEKLLFNGNQITGVELSKLDKYGQVAKVGACEVRARHTVLSAGAIGSPAILMRSGFSDLNKNIGKRTFLHPVTASIAKMPELIAGYQGAPQSIYSDQFLWRDGVSGEMGYKIEVPPLHPIIASTLLRKHGQEHYELLKDFSHLQANLALMRDGFNGESGGEVSLDKYGYPHLDYQINDALWRGMRHAMLSLVENQFAAGAESVFPLHMDAQQFKSWKMAKAGVNALPAEKLRWQIMSAHVMGGCGMNTSKEKGVCDENGIVFGLQNLSVLDGSLFPTSLGVNPQLSIYAIVAKLAATKAVLLGGKLPGSIQNIVNRSEAQHG